MTAETVSHLEKTAPADTKREEPTADFTQRSEEVRAARTQREQRERTSRQQEEGILAKLDRQMQAAGHRPFSMQPRFDPRAAEEAAGLIAGDARIAEREFRAAAGEGKSMSERAWHTVMGLAEIPVIGAIFKPIKFWKKGKKVADAMHASRAAAEGNSLAVKGFPKLSSMSMREAWSVAMPELQKMRDPKLFKHVDIAKESLHTSAQILRNVRDFIQEASMSPKADKWGMSAEQVATHANTMRETAMKSIEDMLRNLKINYPDLYKRNMAKFDSLAQELYSINIHTS